MRANSEDSDSFDVVSTASVSASVSVVGDTEKEGAKPKAGEEDESEDSEWE